MRTFPEPGQLESPGILVHQHLKYLVFSPDGILSLPAQGSAKRCNILLEVKTSSNKITPGVYKHQVQLGLLVSQADYAIVLCYKTDAKMTSVREFDESRITQIRVDADAQWRAEFLSKAATFYSKYVEWLFLSTPDYEAGKRVLAILF